MPLHCQCYTFLRFDVSVLKALYSYCRSLYFQALVFQFLIFSTDKPIKLPWFGVCDLALHIQYNTNLWIEFDLTQWLTHGRWNPQCISVAESGLPCYHAEGPCFHSFHWNTNILPISKQKTSGTWCQLSTGMTWNLYAWKKTEIPDIWPCCDLNSVWINSQMIPYTFIHSFNFEILC